jgi:threonine synthase
MDIQSASNFERLVFEAMGRDGRATGRVFEIFDQTGAVDLTDDMMDRFGPISEGVSASEAQVDAAMRASLDAGGVVDPHTAVALAGLAALPTSPHGPTVVLSTAHPAKFPEAVLAATGSTPAAPAAASRLGDRPEAFDRLPADAAAVKAYVRAFATA